jgi:hypothetical protein
LESGALDGPSSERFYYLLSSAAHQDENWIGALTHAKRGLNHSQDSCSGFYFPLQKVIFDAHLQLGNVGEAEEAIDSIIGHWEQLSCESQRELAQSGKDLGETFDFESLSRSERQRLHDIETLSNLADMYWVNSRVVNEARQNLDQLQSIRSDAQGRVATCKADARSRYEREWARACRNEADDTTRAIRVCFHNRLPTARLSYRNESLAEASARDYCEALHGSVDNSDACALPRSLANRLNARMETAIRRCNQIMDAFD